MAITKKSLSPEVERLLPVRKRMLFQMAEAGAGSHFLHRPLIGNEQRFLDSNRVC